MDLPMASCEYIFCLLEHKESPPKQISMRLTNQDLDVDIIT